MLIQSDARQIPLKDESVQCCVTSPPYWGLRDYGIAPRVWSGQEDCEHEWTDEIEAAKRGHPGFGTSTLVGTQTAEHQKSAIHQGTFCSLCSAWRGSLGLEPTPELYVEHIVSAFREVRRVLRKDGTVWLNLGDSYNGGNKGNSGPLRPGDKQGTNIGSWSTRRRDSGTLSPTRSGGCVGLKVKDLCGIPWRVAFALQADGWWLRSDIIWSKPNPMPESVTDRPTRSHEYLFLLAKSERYYFDQEAVREPLSDGPLGGRQLAGMNGKTAPRSKDYHEGMKQRMSAGNDPPNRNIRSVWTIATQPFPDAHFATFPETLVKPCILAGTSHKGCCPKCGKPWERIVEKTSITPKDYEGKYLGVDSQANGRRMLANVRARRESGEDHDNPFPATRTLGWKPVCGCGIKETRACVVFDPFAGSGTVVKLAQDLGRIGIGMDMKPEYLAMAKKRTAQQGFGKLLVGAVP